MAENSSGLVRGVRAAGAVTGRWLHRTDYLKKWLFLGALIGVVAGLGAIGFYWLLESSTGWLLRDIGGYTPPTAAGDGGHSGSGTGFSAFTRPWAIPLTVGGGALLSALLVFTFAPEAEGHGTDAAIKAIHQNPRGIRPVTVAIKLIASALTIGSGGSGGREGPTAQISAGFGSVLARWFDLRPGDGRIAVGVGIGSGIGAIFGAPLGGAVLAASIAYKEDFDNRVLIPGFITSIVAFAVFGSVEGYAPLFGDAATSYRFTDPAQLLWFAVIGIIAGVIGIAYSRGFYGTVRLNAAIPGAGRWSKIAKATVGGVLVGLMGLAMPQVLGTGYGWAQKALEAEALLMLPLWLVIVLPLAKIAATSLSIGTGGSGGIFGPGVVIGAFVGAAVWRVLHELDAPWLPDGPAPFAVVGMMACFGSIAHVPLAVMLMVAEMTGSYNIMVPGMLAVGLAYLLVRQTGDTIYSEQLDSRESEYANRVSDGLPLLDRIQVFEVRRSVTALSETDHWAQARTALAAAPIDGLPVIDADGRMVGVLDTAAAEQADPGEESIRSAVRRDAGSVRDSATLETAVQALPAGHRWLTVVDDERKVCGIVTVADIVGGYRRAVDEDARRFGRIAEGAEFTEMTVGAGSAAIGTAATALDLPAGALVLSVMRGPAVLPADDELVMAAGDTVTVLSAPEDVAGLRALLGGEPASVAGA